MQNVSSLNKLIINFNHVGKVYPGNQQALADVSLFVRESEFFCLVGPSGCGKSTVLKIIARLEKASGGQIQIPAEAAMVFQSGALFPWLTVLENVSLGLKARGASFKKIVEEAHKYLEMVGLLEFEQKYPRDLSGGQRQRVGLARALAVEPQVLLLDEPFSALDAATTEELHKDLLKIWQATKKTIVMVSHSIEEAVSLADRVMLMKAGQVVQIFEINLPYPRREQMHSFIEVVHKIRKEFFT